MRRPGPRNPEIADFVAVRKYVTIDSEAVKRNPVKRMLRLEKCGLAAFRRRERSFGHASRDKFSFGSPIGLGHGSKTAIFLRLENISRLRLYDLRGVLIPDLRLELSTAMS